MNEERVIERVDYVIEPTLEYNPDGLAMATWDGDRWDFGTEMHCFYDLDEATDAYHKAQEDTENIKAITMYAHTTYEDDTLDVDTDVVMQCTFEPAVKE